MVVTAVMLTTTLLPSFAFAAPTPSDDWTASWIWDSAKPSGDEEGDQWVNFRKDFELTTVPETAVAKISAESRYWLYINDELVVFEGGLKRGVNREDGYYDTIDIAKYLKTGKNTIAVAVWYYGVTSLSFTGWCASAAGFLFEADLGDITVKSDDSWKVKRDRAYLHSKDIEDATVLPGSRFIESNIYYDASKEISDTFMGWTESDFDDSDWQSAVERADYGDSPWNKLYERNIPLLKFDKQIQSYKNPEAFADYTNAYTTEQTVIRMKLPYNAQVTPYLEIEAQSAGAVIDMRTDTYNYHDYNDTKPDNYYSINSVKSAYVTKAGAQSFEALGWFSGEEVIYTVPAGVKIINLGYRESGYDAEFTGSFVSDDEGLNTLWQKAVRTLYVTMRDNYMDCPDRERAQWWGDVTSEMYMALYSLDPRSWDLYEKGLYTKLGFIKDDILYTVVPNTNYYAEYVQQELAGVVGVWQYYMHTGRKYIIEDFYEAGKNYLALWNMQEDGLIEHRSFNKGYDSWVDWGSNCDVTATENAWYYMALDAVINMAKLLGKTDDIPALKNRKSLIADAFESFWTDNGYKSPYIASKTYPDDRANALAVISGLATPDKYDTILGILTNPDNYFAGPYFEKYILDAMVKMGAVKEAQARIKDRYAEMINSDISTLYEGWSFPDKDHPAWSKNHAWTGGPLITMSKDMAGISPIEAGYSTYQIKPVLADLNSITATVPSAIGNITANIVKGDDGTYTMDITSLGGTAVVAVPRVSGKATVVSVNDTVVFDGTDAKNNVSGVIYCKNDADYIYFNASAGTYKFVTTVSAKESDEYMLSIPAGVGGNITATVGGSEVELPFNEAVTANTEVVVSATADADHKFTGFGGTIGTDNSTLTFNLTQDTKVEAQFEEIEKDNTKTVTVDIPDGSDVEVYINGERVKNGGKFKADIGTTLTLQAKDGKNFKFVNFEGDFYSASKQTEFKLADDMTISVKSAFCYITMYEAGNVALGATVTSSDLYNIGSWKTTGLTDGDYAVGATSHQNPSLPHTITLDLGESKTFNTVTLYPRTDEICCFPKNFTVQISSDGSTYNTLATYTNISNVNSPFVISCDTVSAQYIKITTTALGNKSSAENGARVQLMEVEAAYIPETSTNTVTIKNADVSTGTGKVLINNEEYTLPAQITVKGNELVKLEAVADDGCVFSGFNGGYNTASSVMYFYALNNLELSASFIDCHPDDADATDSTNYALGGSVNVKNTSGTSGLNVTYYGNANWKPEFLTDGLVGHTTKLGCATRNTTVGYEIIVTMKALAKISQVVMYARTDSGGVSNSKSQGYVPAFDISVSTDGVNYTKVKSVTGETDIDVDKARRVYNFDSAYDAKYIKITATTINGNIHIQELEAYNAPVNRLMNATVTNGGKHLQTNPAQSWYYGNLTDGYTMKVGTKEGYSSADLADSQDISASPFELEMNMGSVKNINQVVLYGRQSDHATSAGSGICPCFPENFTIQVSTDGINYTTVKTVSGETNVTHSDNKRVYELDYYVPAKYVKIVVTRLGASTAAEGAKNIYRVQLTEIEANLVQREYTPPTLSVSIADGTKYAGYSFEADVNTTSDNIILTIEDENGNVSDIADITGTTVNPKSAATAYLVARDQNCAVATSKVEFTVIKPAVENKNTQKAYESITDAIANAEAGETLKLIDNVSDGRIVVTPDVTLDLNGFNVTADYFVALNGGAVIDTSSVTDRIVNEEYNVKGATKTGGIYVPKDNVIISNITTRDEVNKKNTAYVPVYDSNSGCYRFIQTEMRDNQFKVDGGNFTFMPIIGATAEERNGIQKDLLATDNITESGIKLKVRVTWITDGYSASQDFAMKDNVAKEFIDGFGYVVGDRFVNNYKNKNTAIFTGAALKQADYVYISAVVASETGAEVESIITEVDTSTLK